MSEAAPEDLYTLARRLPLPRLARLAIHGSGEALRARAVHRGPAPAEHPPPGLPLLRSSPLAPRLRALRLAGCRLGGMLPGGAARLDLPALEDLDLAGCGLGDYAAGDLLCARLPALRRLGLSGNRLTDRGLPALLAAPGVVGRLRALDLSANKLTDDGLLALAAAPLTALRDLDLWSQRGAPALTDAGLSALAAAAWAPELARLRLGGNERLGADRAALAALAASGAAGLRAAAEIEDAHGRS